MLKISKFIPIGTRSGRTLVLGRHLFLFAITALVAPTVWVSYLLFSNQYLGLPLAFIWLPILWVLLVKIHNTGIIRVTLSLPLIAIVTAAFTFNFLDHENIKESPISHLSDTSKVTSAENCPDGSVTFNFENISTLSAFAIFADYSGLKPDFDLSIKSSQPMKFKCRNWLVVAKELAKKHHLNLRIENGTMYVSRK